MEFLALFVIVGVLCFLFGLLLGKKWGKIRFKARYRKKLKKKYHLINKKKPNEDDIHD